jgi:uncharacterized Zn-finger protein
LNIEKLILMDNHQKLKMKPKIIHTKEFHCDDDHPIVYYVVDENNEGMCEYCSTKFIYKEKKDDKAWVNNVLKGSG